jgi:hypothetical protein
MIALLKKPGKEKSQHPTSSAVVQVLRAISEDKMKQVRKAKEISKEMILGVLRVAFEYEKS